MAKGRDRPHREAKKPKANKKTAPVTSSAFLKTPSPAAPPAKPKDTEK